MTPRASPWAQWSTDSRLTPTPVPAIYWGKDGVNGGKLPFYYAGSNGSDADVYFEQYFRTGGSKRINYNNPEFEKLIDEEQRTGDPKKRIAILHQAGRILMEDVPYGV